MRNVSFLSPQLRGLQVNEVLDAIFATLDKGSLASCSCVCRGWELLANRVLWRGLKKNDLGMVNLAQLLAPLDETLNHGVRIKLLLFQLYP